MLGGLIWVRGLHMQVPGRGTVEDLGTVASGKGYAGDVLWFLFGYYESARGWRLQDLCALDCIGGLLGWNLRLLVVGWNTG